MRIKELFTVPEGEKITEKMFAKVLISSVCSMLLCMACLAGTTWAWFTVSVENEGNVIQIGSANVNVTVGDSTKPFESGSTLSQGDWKIHIENSNLPDEFEKKATLYVTLSFGNEVAGYVILDESNGYKADIKRSVGDNVELSWVASWFKPDGTTELKNEISWLNENPTEDPTEDTTAPLSAE